MTNNAIKITLSAAEFHGKTSERIALPKRRPFALWFTGYSAAGKTTVAYALACRLSDVGQSAFVLDGDSLRHGLNSDLGFSPAHRSENIRRTAEVAKLMNAAGLTVICSLISPLRNDREIAGTIIGAEHFIEVHISTSLAECERRDPKGLYRRARAGELPDFTGITSPYEPPISPAISLDTSQLTVEECVDRISKLIFPNYKAVKTMNS